MERNTKPNGHEEANVTTFEQLKRDRIAGAAVQDRINQDLELTFAKLEAAAELRVDATRFPQYRGHFAGWKVVRVPRTIRTKMGLAFEAGDLTIACWQPRNERHDTPATWFAFSFRDGCTTAIGRSVVEVDLVNGGGFV